ncbi:MAG TPA: M28 family peptidase, partial [Puia sp.]|nr:M28 family peptidase [Puia sp.]
MKYIDLIKRLDNMSNYKRREIITNWLEDHQVKYWKHEYATGVNLVVDLGTSSRKIGVSSHFDRVKGSPGANDNSSAMAVCLDMIRKHQENGNMNIGLRIFFFDEE